MESTVRSAYFSVSRFDDADARKDYERLLDSLGRCIALGERVEPETDDLARLRRFLAQGEGWSTSDSLKMVAFVGIWLGSPIALMVTAIWLLNSC